MALMVLSESYRQLRSRVSDRERKRLFIARLKSCLGCQGLAACVVVVLRQRSGRPDGLAASQLFIHEFKAGEVYPHTAQLSAVSSANPYPHDAQVRTYIV